MGAPFWARVIKRGRGSAGDYRPYDRDVRSGVATSLGNSRSSVRASLSVVERRAVTVFLLRSFVRGLSETFIDVS